MGSRNYVINIDDTTLSERAGIKRTALAAGLERCAVKGVGDVYADIPGLQAIPESRKAERVDLIERFIRNGDWPASVTQRELAPATAGDLAVATAIDSWLTAALAVVGNMYSCFQAVAGPQLPAGKLMVCYGVSVESAAVPMPVSRLVFRRGGAAGNVIAQFDLEPMAVRQEWEAFFSEPVVMDPQQVFAIQARCKNNTGVAEIVHVHNFYFEPVGIIA